MSSRSPGALSGTQFSGGATGGGRRLAGGLFSLLLMLAAGVAQAIDTGRAFEDPALQARYERIIAEVRCLTCQNQSIKDSNAFLAADLRREIREQLAAGASDEEIYRFLTDRYGDFALYRPRMGARTALLWLAPLLGLGLGLFVVMRVLRRRSRLPIESDGEAAAPPPERSA